MLVGGAAVEVGLTGAWVGLLATVAGLGEGAGLAVGVASTGIRLKIAGAVVLGSAIIDAVGLAAAEAGLSVGGTTAGCGLVEYKSEGSLRPPKVASVNNENRKTASAPRIKNIRKRLSKPYRQK